MRQHVFRRLAWITAIGLALGVGANGAAVASEMIAGRLSHLAMMREVARDAVREMLASVPLAPGGVVSVAPARLHAGNDVVGHALAEALVGAGHEVRVLTTPIGSEPAAPDAAAPVGGAGAGSAAPAASGAGSTPTSPPHDEGVGPDPGDDDADEDAAGDDRDEPLDDGAGDGAGDDDGSDDEAPSSMIEHLMSREGSIAAPGAEVAGGTMPSHATLPADGPLLVFDVGRFDLRYVGQRRPYLFGRKQVERVAAVDVTCELRPGGDVVSETGHGDAISIDWISQGKLAAFEGGGIAPTELSGGNGLRFVEPVIVSGIVAGLVYLFYTNQN